MSKVVIIRGNSGSGKSTVARILQKKAKTKTVIIQQDYFRRIFLNVDDTNSGECIEIMLKNIDFAFEKGYNVIIEGIFHSKNYLRFFDKVVQSHPDNNFIFYFDIPFEETLVRHETKPNSSEFGETEMRGWYAEKDYLVYKNEVIFDETISKDKIVATILQQSNL